MAPQSQIRSRCRLQFDICGISPVAAVPLCKRRGSAALCRLSANLGAAALPSRNASGFLSSRTSPVAAGGLEACGIGTRVASPLHSAHPRIPAALTQAQSASSGGVGRSAAAEAVRLRICVSADANLISRIRPRWPPSVQSSLIGG